MKFSIPFLLFATFSVVLPCNAQVIAPDASFANNGILSVPLAAWDVGRKVMLQPDGKLLALVSIGPGAFNGDFGLVRTNPDGTLDDTFDGDGKVITSINGEDGAFALALQPDGKILVGGYTYTNPQTTRDFAMARYNPDGSLDTTFNHDGIAVTSLTVESEQIKNLAVMPDGKIIVTGFISYFNFADFVIARFNADGSLDLSFGFGGGFRSYDVGQTSNEATAFKVLPDGKFLLGGFSGGGNNNNFTLMRLAVDGSPDSTFNGNGIVVTDFAGFNDRVQSLAVQADGKYLAAGYASSDFGMGDFAAARYLENGSLDSTFGTFGKMTLDLGGTLDQVWSCVVLGNGNILLGGQAGANGSSDFALARLLPGGALDLTFADSGTYVHNFGGDNPGYDMLVQPDQKIVMVGYGSYDLAVVRYAEAVPNGINEAVASESTLSVFPNPADQQLTLAFNSSQGQEILVSISDLNGRAVLQQKIGASVGMNNFTIPLSTLAPSIYMVVLNDGMKVWAEKVVVER